MSKRPTNDWKQPSNQKSPKEIRREQAKKFSRKAKPKHIETPKEKADKWNERFDFAETKLKAGSDDIAKYLQPMLQHLANGDKLDRSIQNKYFSIDDSYDGNPATLFQHVTFKELPKNDPTIDQYLKKIEDVKGTHLTPQAYDKYSQDWHKRSGQTLANKLELSNYDILEQIMNSSPAWQIAKKSSYDSEQALDRWLELYDSMNNAQAADTGVFDWAIQQIENGKHSIDWLINAIDDEIRLKLTNGYSRRRKLHY